jgi:Cu(I)/Ag(I) efflux system membrane fusion protein
LSKIDIKLLKDEVAHNHWKSLEKQIKASATLILNTTNIKEQRNDFKHLSSHLTNAIEVFGINQKVYHQFCPMADDNNGAYWLSKEEKVINPYFGDAMLTCGEVKQVIE